MRNIVDIEKTIEFILSHQANAEVQMEKIRESIVALTAQTAALAARGEAQAEALTAQAEAQTAAPAAHAAAQAEALTAQAEAQTASLAAQAEAQAKGYAQHEVMLAKIDARLDRAIRLSVRDARNERKRRQEMAEEWDRKITQLSAAQLVTEEKMQVKEKMRVTEETWRVLGEKLQAFLNGLQRGNNGHN
jgi:hypothetical protein